MNKQEVDVKVAELQKMVGQPYISRLTDQTYIVDKVSEISKVGNPNEYEIIIGFHKEPIEIGDEPMIEYLLVFITTYFPIA